MSFGDSFAYCISAACTCTLQFSVLCSDRPLAYSSELCNIYSDLTELHIVHHPAVQSVCGAGAACSVPQLHSLVWENRRAAIMTISRATHKLKLQTFVIVLTIGILMVIMGAVVIPVSFQALMNAVLNEVQYAFQHTCWKHNAIK